MSYLYTKLMSQVYADSSRSRPLPARLEVNTGLDVGDAIGVYKTIANGASDVRLDPFTASAPDVDTVNHIELLFSGQVSIRIGTVSATQLTLASPYRLVIDVALTRSATTGLWVSNASGADVTVEGILAEAGS